MGKRIKDYVFDLAKPIVESYGLELVEVEYQQEGANWFLRVFIDKEDGVDLDDCQNISQEISAQLDIEDPIEDSYILEVSSPGLDRPLKTEEDFQRFTGQTVDISTYAPVEGKRDLQGELLGLVEDKIKIRSEEQVIEVPKDKVAKVSLALEF